MNEYKIYRKDRNAAGGGVATSVRETLRHSQRNDTSDSDLEIVCTEIMPKNAKNFIILCWYRPPTNDLDTASFKASERILSKLDSEDKEVIIIGDTNCDFYVSQK